MSISRLVARHSILTSPAIPEVPRHTGIPLDLLVDAKTRALPVPGQPDKDAASDGAQDRTNGTTSALEVLARYFPTEVFAIYVFGLGGLATVSKDMCEVPIGGAASLVTATTKAPVACVTQLWLGLIAVSLLLILFFVTVNWVAWNNTARDTARVRNAALKAAGEPEVAFTPATFPIWVTIAQVIAFGAWAMATPGNPLVTTAGATFLVGFVALTSSHVLAGLETVLGEVQRRTAGDAAENDG